MDKLSAITRSLAKKYTDESVEGAGAIKGKNCQIQSIEPITGGNRVTFAWYDGSDVLKSGTMDVMDGVDGQDGAKGDKGDKGDTGETGATGNGIATIVKTSTVGLVDTYTITMTNGDTATFTVTNGQDGTTTDENAYHVGDTNESNLADDDYFPFYDTSATAKRKSSWGNIKSKIAYVNNLSFVTESEDDVVNLITIVKKYLVLAKSDGTSVRDVIEIHFEKYVTLSTSSTTTVTFTNPAFTSSSAVDYGCSVYGIFPDDIVIDGTTHTCTVTMPKVDTAVRVMVAIYLR